ncbi:hypothetical protein [Crocosphaera watsonii]|uniref:Uncharacterized protein n=5 Tax=Crocosphaera watsonii TaxID=263511 RepID=T2JTY1_CROWT|nr:hypothetical protein [Crocosphaera watsonii]EHJ10957.1 hypothetical protein CWATWH0003_4292 [Crocosphaera watsonii WH 0003]CCQ49040.1 hypothetical protein CWATWH8502_4582 [Crocosphaera watsonii WH 8502]CCQ55806.1 hypothetical protein CWATWH0005_1689 [Crocosphaera watsonii WH 0005]CCQ61340.1 hypothetical protein CWATWH0401_2586 [Crocosphaera watsonii WH 0401]CCQ68534.1 hypothetical protein CWATWH0402_4454 [Crocosphaera watsonii WH 0402]
MGGSLIFANDFYMLRDIKKTYRENMGTLSFKSITGEQKTI